MSLGHRQFVTALVASSAAASVPTPSIDGNLPSFSPATSLANPPDAKVDFRYTPQHQQSTICFPDDPRKTIVGQAGDLRCGFAKSLSAGMDNFASVVEFSLAGFQDDKIPRATRQCELKQDCMFFRELEPNASEIGVSSTRSGRPNRAPRTLVEGKQPCDEIRARLNL
jgi:hypothetical protein